MRYLAFVCAVPSTSSPLAAADLESRVAPLAKDHKGKVAVAVEHLKNR